MKLRSLDTMPRDGDSFLIAVESLGIIIIETIQFGYEEDDFIYVHTDTIADLENAIGWAPLPSSFEIEKY
jgi:hypothetical protein